MARTRSQVSIDDKIERQKLIVSKMKDRYESAVAELEKLMQKREEIRNKKILEVIDKSAKSYDEIIAFLNDNSAKQKH